MLFWARHVIVVMLCWARYVILRKRTLSLTVSGSFVYVDAVPCSMSSMTSNGSDPTTAPIIVVMHGCLQ